MRLFVALLLSVILSQPAVGQTATPRADTTTVVPTAQDSIAVDTVRAHTLKPVSVRDRMAPGSRYAPRLNRSALKTAAVLRDIPQSVSVVSNKLMKDQGVRGLGEALAYVPGVTVGQGEGNRDQIVLRGNSSTADFFVDGVRDDVQYYRDIYNVERVEALKGSNAMIFGRGGGGGVLNRVMKQAGWTRVRELTAEGGAFGHTRFSADIGTPVNASLAARLPVVYQSSRSFRAGVDLERFGLSPTITFGSPDDAGSLVLSYEHFQDHRTADRGIPSLAGRPYESERSTFFGDPRASYSDAEVNAFAATGSRFFGSGVTLTNRTRFASYDKFYRNVFPGALNSAATQVAISAYDNDTQRQNVFNQTDLIFTGRSGRAGHIVLVGAEIGRQRTDNFRSTGHFNGTALTFAAPTNAPTISVPLTFRQVASDADNNVENTVVSVYAQDQIELSQYLQIVGGLRYEIFDIGFTNNRDGKTLSRKDAMLAPRVGVIFKPRNAMSVYGSFSVSHLPSSGDQFSSLTDVTSALEPELFRNYEVGAKWDIGDRIEIATAAYRLDRSNTRANDPVNPARTVQTGSQRTTGYELDVRGSLTSAWDAAAGISWQDAKITSTTTAAREGATVPLVARVVATVWNRYQLSENWAVGAGIIHNAKSYAAIDNTVTLPAYTKIDLAAYRVISRNFKAQLNVENLFDEMYYPNANNNNNISPGAPRTLRVSLTAGF
ncbi:MAG TPA: TonB-dependent siderophore receptor [Gemmatimonadaceae bacterium]|nr:TonB-dependent siderophore receptor [Gemmatimonadaceae bacterium]